ncbi:hypothetical protein KKB18_09115 [bacterium]|nr:hypothetical protein [bacterium]
MIFKYCRIRRNLFARIEGIQLVKSFLLSGFSLSVAVLIFLFFYRIFNYLKMVDIFGEMLTIRLITMVFLSFLSMLIFSNILTSISVLYMAKDVEFLLSTPMKTRVIYYFKFMETLFHSSYMIMMFGIPVFAAYGFAYDAKLPFFPLAFLAFIPFLIIPAALGTGITQFLMRFLPAKRTHQVMLALGVFFLVIMIMSIRFLEPEKLLSPMGAQFFTEYLENMRIPAPLWLPSTMTAEAIVAACKAEYSKFTFFFFSLSIISIAFYFISSKIATSIYRKGWDDSKILKPRTNVRKSSDFFYFCPKFLQILESGNYCDDRKGNQIFRTGYFPVVSAILARSTCFDLHLQYH